MSDETMVPAPAQADFLMCDGALYDIDDVAGAKVIASRPALTAEGEPTRARLVCCVADVVPVTPTDRSPVTWGVRDRTFAPAAPPPDAKVLAPADATATAAAL